MPSSSYHIFNKCFIDYDRQLLEEMAACGIPQTVKAGEYLVREGQHVRSLPIVLEGAIKVQSEENGEPFLLYYILPGATCVFSFGHLFGDKPINFSGVAELDTNVLLIPVSRAREWLGKYPAFSNIIFKEYQKRYDDLLETTKQLICYNLEERLTHYLNDKVKITGNQLLNVSHQLIASDLGTSREVISRLMKKLQTEGRILQAGRKIKVVFP